MVLPPHLDDDEIERYSMGTIAPERLAPFEEHLLLCAACQHRVAASDAYVAAMRGAASELLRKKED